MEDKAITDVKASFIRTQVRQLSAPLQPSSQWKEFVPQPEEGHLSDATIQDVVSKVNDRLSQHSRMVYSAHSQRHIAEQLATLYWNEVKAQEDDEDINAIALPRKSDLSSTETILELPEDCDDLCIHPGQTISEEEKLEYETLREELRKLSSQRDEKRQSLARHRHLRELLAPYEKPPENIQPNLVTKDGELAKELDRTRMLLARVTARMENANGSNANSSAKRKPGLTDRQNLQQIMELT